MIARLKNIFKKLTGGFKIRRSAAADTVRDPVAVWGKLVVFFGLVLVISIASNLYFFYQISSGEYADHPAIDSQEEALNQNPLKKAAGYYNDRAERLAELKEKKPDVVDPSL